MAPNMTTRVQFPEPTEAKDRTESHELSSDATCMSWHMYNAGDKLFPKTFRSLRYHLRYGRYKGPHKRPWKAAHYTIPRREHGGGEAGAGGSKFKAILRDPVKPLQNSHDN